MRLSLLVAAGLVLSAGCAQRDNTEMTTSPGGPKAMAMFAENRSRETVEITAEPAGYSLVKVTDTDAPHYDGDVGPAQLFEVIRPDNAAVKLGRMWTSCTCIQSEASKKEFAEGERALVVVRHVKPAKPGGETFLLSVKVTSPVDAMVSAYVTVGQ